MDVGKLDGVIFKTRRHDISLRHLHIECRISFTGCLVIDRCSISLLDGKWRRLLVYWLDGMDGFGTIYSILGLKGAFVLSEVDSFAEPCLKSLLLYS